jgi:hypothetical protein
MVRTGSFWYRLVRPKSALYSPNEALERRPDIVRSVINRPLDSTDWLGMSAPDTIAGSVELARIMQPPSSEGL